MYQSEDKMVSNPSHYQTKSGLEAIDVIKAFTEDLTGYEAVATANVLRYILRWKKKNGIQDIEKVIWYATDLLEYLKGLKKPEEIVDIDNLDLFLNCEEMHFSSSSEMDEVTNQIYSAYRNWGKVTLYHLCSLFHLNPDEDLLNYGWTCLDKIAFKCDPDIPEYVIFMPKYKRLS